MRTSIRLLLVVSMCIFVIASLASCGGGGGGGITPPVSGSPSTVTAQSILPVGDPNCPTGGVQLDYGIDDNANGVLDPSEVDGSDYICNGASGQTALINTTSLAVGDANCPNGGYQVDSGLDANANSVLDPAEITSTSYLCNEVKSFLSATTVSTSQIILDWSSMAGDPSVAFYEVYQDRSWIHSTADASTLSYSVTGLTKSTVYCFMVTGMDSFYNVVVQSPEVCAATGGGHPPWKATSTIGAPSVRNDHTAVWTGTKMVVWGGLDGGDPPYLNNGGMYDPTTDTWKAITTAGAPPGRYGFSTVWTGTKMVVWGGYDVGTYLDSGGIYDPAADVWTVITPTGAPSERFSHSAVWTGTRMIVWGGYNGTNFLNTGGIYNPAMNTWKAINTTGAPSGRNAHTAVWTGTKMVVWGGYDGGTYLDSGGIYDPATDTWTAFSTIGAPSGRRDHTAVWTGTRMIVWGGRDSTNYFNTGGIYYPAMNTWKAVNTIGAPSGRILHTAVLTGTKMVAWGGYDGSTYLDTGGMYDPATDKWTSINTTGAPLRRASHTAVSTGTQMIVWGGSNSSGRLNTGGVCSP